MRNLLVTLHSRSVITLALTLLFPITGTVYGQTATGSISGTVSDPSGSAVPGSRVTLTNVGTNESRSAKASDSGYFSFPLLPPATYRMEAEASGFKRFIRDNLKITKGCALEIPGRKNGAAAVAGG